MVGRGTRSVPAPLREQALPAQRDSHWCTNTSMAFRQLALGTGQVRARCGCCGSRLMTEIGLARATGVLVDRARVTPSSRTEGRHRERPMACAEKPVVSYLLDWWHRSPLHRRRRSAVAGLLRCGCQETKQAGNPAPSATDRPLIALRTVPLRAAPLHPDPGARPSDGA